LLKFTLGELVENSFQETVRPEGFAFKINLESLDIVFKDIVAEDAVDDISIATRRAAPVGGICASLTETDTPEADVDDEGEDGTVSLTLEGSTNTLDLMAFWAV
jgi:hypothetical protein